MPNVDELAAVFVNMELYQNIIGDAYISSSKEGETIWVVAMYSGARTKYSADSVKDATLHCIKR